MSTRGRAIAIWILAGLGIATVLIAILPALSFAYRSPGTHVAFETTGTLASGLAAFILYGRFAISRSRRDWVLFIALLSLATANLLTAFTPAFNGEEAERGAVWLPLGSNLLAAAMLAYAALETDEDPVVGGVWRRLGAIGGAVAVALIALGLLAPTFPTGLGDFNASTGDQRLQIIGSPGLLAGQLITMALFAAAGVGFARRAERADDDLLSWLATAALLAALARLNYFLFPSVYSQFISAGDFLRIAAYLTLLAGALRQIAVYQRLSARTATAAERGRIARDLHDGFAQDLAFIAMTGRRLAEREPQARQIAGAAEQALRASRGTILELRDDDEPLATSISRLATTLTGRVDVGLELQLEDGIEVSAEVRNGLMRVLSESISNAIRHGEASRIDVILDDRDGVRMAVRDDGRGFDRAALEADRADPGASGLGLAGVLERVEQLGGTLRIDSEPGRGAAIEVVLR